MRVPLAASGFRLRGGNLRQSGGCPQVPDSPSLLTSAAVGLGLTSAAVLWVVLLVRLSGLRSLSKMTGFDFVTTIAVGSLIATAGVSTSWSTFAQALAGIGGLFGLHWLLAKWRVHSNFAQRVLGNEPILLMEHGRFIQEALTSERIARADIYAKMRGAGIMEPDQVRAVVLERTGDISIIKDGPLDDSIMSGIANRSR